MRNIKRLLREWLDIEEQEECLGMYVGKLIDQKIQIDLLKLEIEKLRKQQAEDKKLLESLRRIIVNA